MKLDHLLWAAPDLDAGIDRFEELTGVRPALGGSHPGFGTRNALASLGETYIEVIAPDPEQTLLGTLGEQFASLNTPYLYSAAYSSGDLGAVRPVAQDAGLNVGEIIEMSRTRPNDGVTLDWAIMKLTHSSLGDRFPFLIDWKGSPHPSGTTPGGLSLLDFRAVTPEPVALAATVSAIGMTLVVDQGDRAGFVAQLSTPNGTVTLV